GLSPWAAVVFGAGVCLALPIALRLLTREQSTRLQRPGDTAQQILIAGIAAASFVGALAFAMRASIQPGPLFGVLTAQMVCLGALRVAMIVFLRMLRRRGRNFRQVLVIGTGPRARELSETIARHPEWGLQIAGYVDDGDYSSDPLIPSDRIHKLIDFPDLLRDWVVDEVIVACPRSMLAFLGPAVGACSAAGVPFTMMTDLFGDYLPPPRVRYFASHEALTFAPVHHDALQLAIKRSIDLVGATLGLVIAAPVILLSAAAIKLDSRGPVFFKQIRSGLYGRPIKMYKLRTMVDSAEADRDKILHLNEMNGPVFKIRCDPRITRVGRFLRIFSIDELPQLWSVIIGDMSLVGPRPPMPCEVVKYETAERRRLSMRPGLTCLWQVSGRNAVEFDEWVKLDLQYIDSWSLWNDTKILLMTIPVVLRGTGS
ncbi:MAG: sugar transferase, partial [Deltaproteobacteria bacterium]|nr:sugar transferase [Deltaproteobacteria bacterium]